MSLTLDIDPRFDKEFPRACERIGCKPLDLLRVIFSESGGRPSAHNKGPSVIRTTDGTLRPSEPHERYNAVGLIQFMPATLLGLGWREGYEAFKHLSASQQLPYVVSYFLPWQKDGAPWDSAGRLYQACFLPGTLKSKRDPDDVLTARHGTLGWAYEANAVFDSNGDGAITIGELTEACDRNARGARFNEVVERLGLASEHDGPTSDDHALSLAIEVEGLALDQYLRTPRGLQAALARLGYDLGAHGVDGFVGKATRTAVMAFQKEHECPPIDGIAGPKTRESIAIALVTAQ